MAYFPDLSPCRYITRAGERDDLAVGWLDEEHSYPRGKVTDRFTEALWQSCQSPVVQHRGFHPCPFCPRRSGMMAVHRGAEERRLGSKVIRVHGIDGESYAAPDLIYHYVTAHGYRPPDEFIAALVLTGRPQVSERSFELARLRAALKPFRLYWFPRLRSTNGHAALLRKRGGLFAPAVVLAGRQTAGRGRGEHTWWSGPGCLTVTFVLPAGEIEPHRVPLLAGLAVRNAAAELSGSDAIRLKWPNDVLLADARGFRKLAGLLCERVVNADLVGLGLNVNLGPARAPRALRGQMASLAQAAKRPIDMTDTLSTVAAHLRRTFDRATKEPFAAILREYDGHHALVGRTVSVIAPGEAAPLSGRCEGLDEIGRLLLRSRSTLHRVIAGQVAMLDS